MTSEERIAAALAALDKATPGPWRRVNTYCKIADETYVKMQSTTKSVAFIARDVDLTLIAAAPDLAREVIRLREALKTAAKWSSSG